MRVSKDSTLLEPMNLGSMHLQVSRSHALRLWIVSFLFFFILSYDDRHRVKNMEALCMWIFLMDVGLVWTWQMMRVVGSGVLAGASLVDNEREHAGSQAMAAAMVVH